MNEPVRGFPLFRVHVYDMAFIHKIRQMHIMTQQMQNL